MEMQGSRALAATQQQAWEGLNDPEVLKACIPGCERIERVADDRFNVGLAIRVGPVAAKFTGKITLSDVQAPRSYTLAFDGQGGAAGFGKGTAKVELAPAGSGCDLAYAVQAQVGGKIAQVGQRLIDGVARSMAEDFFKRFDAEMQRRYPPAGAPAAAPTPAPERPTIAPWLWIVIAAAVAAVGYWLLR
ncbi:carbon monoxide dehydrogenase subunit G [Ramlibacter tataouinensis]|uniref:CoxG family protein n=1 Tax=Ramlibacter tataouinensis TaxID=94132 RepID=UPI0022F39A52|nr:carbon monoxide dehydrogenase subunit G [Ramlibacter tataouinensis]WBY01012.1 carbon monoxide dehydrogenase subunit G [Ramlibacter tataouinensis]